MRAEDAIITPTAEENIQPGYEAGSKVGIGMVGYRWNRYHYVLSGSRLITKLSIRPRRKRTMEHSLAVLVTVLSINVEKCPMQRDLGT